MIIQLNTYKQAQRNEAKAQMQHRDVPASPALERVKPAEVLGFAPYKTITETRIVLRPRTANGAVRGKRAHG